MKNTLLKLTLVAAASVALLQSAQATLITGNIGFTGSAHLDSASVNTATEVISWVSPVVVTPGSTSGSFPSALELTPVTIQPNWFFNTPSPIAGFWTVGGFTFDLLASSIVTQVDGGLLVSLVGTVIGPGYELTAFSGQYSTQDPANVHPDGTVTFTGSFSFKSVPDGATTMLLLGATLSGLAVIRRKLVA